METLLQKNRLAIHGGKPVRDKYLTYGHRWLDEDDIKAVIEVLKSDWITQGPKIKEFEKAIADFVGAKHAVAVSSGTAALHAACFAAGITQGDEVITTPITFVASSNCVLYMGGKPIFADIKEYTHNIDPKEIEKNLTDKTKTIIPVDFAGQPADLDEIYKIARKHNLVVIEDASHALGAEYKINPKSEIRNPKLNDWIKVGNSIHSDMAIFSFHPVKPITTGEGGMVVTNNKEYYEKLLMFRTHGITKDPDKFVNEDWAFNQLPVTNYHSPSPWYYEMQDLGYNYRITDFQCALGISQLKKLDRFLERRREIANQYNDAFKEIDELTIPITNHQFPITKPAWHIYVVRLKLEKLKAARKDMFEALRAENIGVQVHYIPVYYHPHYQKLGYQKGICPKAEKYYEEAITLPISSAMKDKDVDDVIKAVKKVIAYYRK
jgi:UDP-4-amino-4,6-dideoxy-N-acetyl-beta-L-altrosamine transaminase